MQNCMKIIEDTYYLSESDNLARFLTSTDLCQDEVESIVGRFAKHSSRAGQLRGEVICYIDGTYGIRHHFTKKILWEEL